MTLPGSDRPAAFAETQRRALALDLGAPVAIRVSPRARRLSLRVDAAARGGRAGAAARRRRPSTALQFLDAHRGWIAARLAALPPPVPFVDGAVVPVFGRAASHPPRARPGGAAGRDRRRRDPGARRPGASAAPGARPSDRAGAARARRAAPATSPRGSAQASARVGVRDPKSRWGSCSSTGQSVVQLAAGLRARGGDRLRRRARGRASGRDEPRRRASGGWSRRSRPDTAGPRAWLKRHRARLLSYG